MTPQKKLAVDSCRLTPEWSRRASLKRLANGLFVGCLHPHTEGNSVRSWKPGHSDQRRRLTGAARQGKDTKSIKKSTRSKTIGATIKSVCLQQILATA